MKKRFTVVQIVPADSLMPGLEFKKVMIGGSYESSAWIAEANFDSREEAEEFISSGEAAKNCNTGSSYGYTFYQLTILEYYVVENPNYKKYEPKVQKEQ